MLSSGTTAKATISASAIELLPADASNTYGTVCIINESTVAGFFSLDGGATWARWPEGGKTLVLTKASLQGKAVQFKRDGSTDVSDLYAWAV